MKYRFIPLHAKSFEKYKNNNGLRVPCAANVDYEWWFLPLQHSLAECAALNSFIWLQFWRSDHVCGKQKSLTIKSPFASHQRKIASVKGGQKVVTGPIIVAWSSLRFTWSIAIIIFSHTSQQWAPPIYLFVSLAVVDSAASHFTRLQYSFFVF